MIIINKKKEIEEYKFKECKFGEMSKIQHFRAQRAWLKKQEMEATLINIKSVDVQVKDIIQMRYSQNPQLLSLFAKLNLNTPYNDEDYINISKRKKENRTLIYALVSAEWILNLEELENKSPEELEKECFDLQNRINVIKSNKNKKHLTETTGRLHLLEYKLTCLSEFLLSKKDEKTLERQLVKKYYI